MNKERIMKVVLETLTNVVSDIPELNGVEINDNTQLLTESSFIDSLTLVSFVVDLEARLSEELDIHVTLTDDRAMTRDISPFENVQNLTDYIYEIVQSD